MFRFQVSGLRFFAFACFLFVLDSAGASDNGWKVVKSRHFLVHHHGDAVFAEKVSRESERLYRTIAEDLGFTRYDGFWTWESRVKIHVYASKIGFQTATRAPEWAAGKAAYAEKSIATYQNSAGFLEAVLPHELAHLIFRDFVGFKGEVPTWLDEGVAQWAESGKRAGGRRRVQKLLRDGKLMGIRQLTLMNVAKVKDPRAAGDFYAQSADLIGFLIRENGSVKFRKFCGALRDGKSLDDALRFTYPTRIRTIEDLEKAWVKSLGEG